MLAGCVQAACMWNEPGDDTTVGGGEDPAERQQREPDDRSAV